MDPIEFAHLEIQQQDENGQWYHYSDLQWRDVDYEGWIRMDLDTLRKRIPNGIFRLVKIKTTVLA